MTVAKFSPYRRWSIQRKLVVSMLACLACVIAVSVATSVTLTSRALEHRVVDEELPAVLGGIRAEIQRQIAEPLTASRDMADNHYLLRWEADGLPAAGLEAFKAYAARLKEQRHAASVFWVSKATGQYLTEAGLARRLTEKDAWFRRFLDGGRPYTLDIDRDASSSAYMLFINARFDAADGRTGVAGLGLSVDSLAAKIRDQQLGRTGSVMLVRPNGTLLVHRDAALVDGQHLLKDQPGFDAASAGALLHGDYAHVRQNAPDGERVAAASFVPELNVYVVATVPRAELLGSVMRAAWTGPVVAGVAGGALALVLVVLVARAIAAPVRRAAALLSEIASGDGDLSRRMRVESDDEVGQLASAFNRFVESLQQMVHQVRKSSDFIADATAEVAAGNLDLSHRTEQASGSLQETAAAMSELNDTVRDNAASTSEADTLARSAHAVATRGGTVMDEVERTMGAIDASSRRIGDIIGVIDGIAFQTNILALNAAVEAARAGEQGRGFAVVAGEVRTLAQRSAQAAKEVRGLIADSVRHVEGGSSQVREAGRTVRELLASVGGVAALIERVSTSTRGQTQGISEVNGAIGQLDTMTQQNAALVEQSSAAAESLREQAAALAGAVGRFKLA